MEYLSDLNTTAEIEAYLCKHGMSPLQASTFVDKVKGMDLPDGYYDLAAGYLTDLLSKSAESLTRH